MARPEKVQEVQDITGRFNNASAALLTEYRGLTVTEIAELRAALREAGAEYKVLKNTLARIAVREVGLEDLVDMLTGPTAIAFIQGDAVEAAKALDDAAKKFPVLIIKGGVLDGKIVDAAQAQALAKLEPREVQLAKIVMMINTPLQQTANVLSAMLRDVGSMLAQVLSQKESDAPEAPAEAPTQEAEAASASDSGEDGEAAADRASAAGEQTSTAGKASDGAAADAAAPEATDEKAETPADETPAVAEAEEQAAAAPEADAAQPEATEEEVSEESASKEEQ